MKNFLGMIFVAAVLTGCTSTYKGEEAMAKVDKAMSSQTESERANAFFERKFNEGVMRSPTYQSYLGIKTDQDKWGDNSDANNLIELEFTKADLKELRKTIDYDKLDDQSKVSYRLFEKQSERQIRRHEYRFHSYPVNQMRGAQSSIPSFMINIHRVSELKDAEAYISRLNGVAEQIDQVIVNLDTREQKGIVAPKFVYPYAINDIDNVLSGQPFSAVAADDSALLADIKGKVNKLDISQTQKDDLIARATDALLTRFMPAFRKLQAHLVQLEKRAGTDDGAWKLPQGDTFYAIGTSRHHDNRHDARPDSQSGAFGSSSNSR